MRTSGCAAVPEWAVAHTSYFACVRILELRAEGNLTQVDSGATASYTYDVLNQCVRIDQGGTSHEFVFMRIEPPERLFLKFSRTDGEKSALMLPRHNGLTAIHWTWPEKQP